jgi:NAD(P)H dehydrogenase (quinone)
MIAVTAASGKLGNLVLEGLLKVIPASEIVAIARSPEKLAQFQARGVKVRRGDYSALSTLGPSLAGVKRLLLISGMDLGRRVAQHRAVIEAAEAAGVELIAYTSLLRADVSTLPIAEEHRETEKLLRVSKVPSILLRNGWYIENYTERLAMSLAQGGFFGAARDGRIAAAARADFADAAVAVLTTEGHAGETYELAGDQPFTMTDLAKTLSEWAERTISYSDLPAAEYQQALEKAGVPRAFVDIAVGTDRAIARGDLNSASHDLHILIGRDTTTLREALANTTKPPANRAA